MESLDGVGTEANSFEVLKVRKATTEDGRQVFLTNSVQKKPEEMEGKHELANGTRELG